MTLSELWEKALRHTTLVRPRIQALETFAATELPYVLLTESQGETSVRRGKVTVEKPSILLPHNMPQFQGFDFEGGVDPSLVTGFLLVRGVSFPSFKYSHETAPKEAFAGPLSRAVAQYQDDLARREDTLTTLLMGPEDAWQFSVLIFIAALVARSAEGDMRRIYERFKRTRWL